MHVCGVAGQQDRSVAVGRGLPRHIGEPGDPGGTVDPVIGPIDGDERVPEVTHSGFAPRSDVRLGDHDPYRAALRVDDLAVADLVVRPAEGMHAEGVVADAEFRLLGQLDLGDAVDRPQVRKVVFLEHHSAHSQPLHGRLDVFNLPRHLSNVLS